MGIIPAAAQDAVASYAADVLAAPLPVAVATVLAVLTVVGLRVLAAVQGASGPSEGPVWQPRRRLLGRSPRALPAAVLPRLPQRVPQTQMARPARAPVVASWGSLRGPPGPDSRPTRTGSGGTSPR